jgi:hypothetical protein
MQRAAGAADDEKLLRRPPLGQRDLLLKEIDKAYSLGLQGLGVERGRGQARQGVGFEEDRPLL